MIEYMEHDSPIGKLLLAASASGLAGLYFEQHKHFERKDEWEYSTDHPILTETVKQLDQYFSGKRMTFDLPLDLRGTAFQSVVWNRLLPIPYGSVISYKEHAKQVGKPTAVRAVGTAIGRNPLCIIIPCHRVLGTSGTLTGYAGGLERKQYLLRLEAHYLTSSC
jgi:methylated-DNA-[protein]-cysteine S-methyltransferase